MTAPAGVTQSETSEDRFASHVASLAQQVHGSERLLEYCDERHPAYLDQPASAISRMRGWVLLALSRGKPFPDAALPFILEELESPRDPYLLTVAAASLRSCTAPPPSLAGPLLQALLNAKGGETPIDLASYGGFGDSSRTSPMREIVAAIARMGSLTVPLAAELDAILQARAAAPEVLREIELVLAKCGGSATSCCPSLPESWGLFRWMPSDRGSSKSLEQVVLEDHVGRRRVYREWFEGHPTILVFFYTRCDNPLKCSLTVAKLGRVQKILEARGLNAIRTAAITYDTDYDTPERLFKYGKNRGMHIDEQNALLRATEGFDALQRHFSLGVSFFDSLVSRHKIEVFVLDAMGNIAASFQRLAWSEDKIVDEAAAILTAPASPNRILASVSPIAGLAALVLPKCPMCWATYMSFLGVTGMVAHPTTFALKATALVMLALHLSIMLWRVRTAGWKLAQIVSMAGAAAVATSLAMTDPIAGLIPLGVGLMLLSSLLTVVQLRPTAASRPSQKSVT
jgi:protein SCO1/2